MLRRGGLGGPAEIRPGTGIQREGRPYACPQTVRPCRGRAGLLTMSRQFCTQLYQSPDPGLMCQTLYPFTCP